VGREYTEKWTKSTREQSGEKVIGRKPIETDSDFELKEASVSYNALFTAEKMDLSIKNSYNWKISLFNTSY